MFECLISYFITISYNKQSIYLFYFVPSTICLHLLKSSESAGTSLFDNGTPIEASL